MDGIKIIYDPKPKSNYQKAKQTLYIVYIYNIIKYTYYIKYTYLSDTYPQDINCALNIPNSTTYYNFSDHI